MPTFKLSGYWNIYACTNQNEHPNVTFALAQDCDQKGFPVCPVCQTDNNVAFLNADFIEEEQ